MLQEMEVHRATDRDLGSLLVLLQQYFAEGSIEHPDSEANVIRSLRMPLLGFYVASDSARLLGCVLCRVLEGMENAAECKRLYVYPESRGSGVAMRLMDCIEAEARAAGLAWMYLDSKSGFHAAMALYKRRGYVECPRFNDNPEATFFFRKQLA